MPRFSHTKLVERIAQLDISPPNATEYATWIKAGGHTDLLRENASGDELVIFAAGPYTFIDAVVVGEDSLAPLGQDDLLSWSGNRNSPRAGYAWGGARDDVWIERGGTIWDAKTPKDARSLVFQREIEGLKGSDRTYFEILQEYSHLSGIHWRSEQRAYCCFDENGDWEPVVSVTSGTNSEDVELVSFKREELEQYLAASNSILVRMFDFTLCSQRFTGWPAGPETTVRESDDFLYCQKIDAGKAAYTRGVQIIRPSRPKDQIFSSMKDRWTEGKDRQYCDFIALDGRNDQVTNISTDPSATTNYFDASTNSLPFEVSPAFFRPEVLAKYKADQGKYTISEEHRTIDCRGGWGLRTYDINEAGQIHTYICYLRSLPHQEQLYWKSFNEEPKVGISERALLNDFKGEWTAITDPLQDILSVLRRWSESRVAWWKIHEETSLERVHTPRAAGHDEWAQAFLDLSKLVTEGFVTKTLRGRLREMDIEFPKDDESLALLERVLIGRGALAEGSKLDGLRTVQAIRSQITSHSSGSRAAKLEKNALEEHGGYTAHFNSVCRNVIDELNIVEGTFS